MFGPRPAILAKHDRALFDIEQKTQLPMSAAGVFVFRIPRHHRAPLHVDDATQWNTDGRQKVVAIDRVAIDVDVAHQDKRISAAQR